MKIALKKATIVILASSFNPSIVTKDWLIREGIVQEDAIKFANVPTFSLFESESFVITVTPDRFEVVLKIAKPVDYRTHDLDSLASVAKTFVEKLPHTPYNAVGLNYIWLAEAEGDENISSILKEKFISDKERFSRLFPEKNYGVGSIIYFQHDGFKVKLAIEPYLETMKHITNNFNYQANTSDYKEIMKKIEMVKDNWDNSKNTVNTLFKEK